MSNNGHIIDVSQFLDQKKFIDWAEIFGNLHPLQLEIGPGKGEFLLEHAAQEPHKNYIGIEIRRKRVDKINSKIVKAGLNNIKLVLEDAGRAVPLLFQNDSIENCFIHFPDPWPKRRHEKKRLITRDFVEILHRVLVLQGKIYITTDVEPYAQTINNLFQSYKGFQNLYFQKDSPSLYHHTIHEWKFKLWGRTIFYFCFTKIE